MHVRHSCTLLFPQRFWREVTYSFLWRTPFLGISCPSSPLLCFSAFFCSFVSVREWTMRLGQFFELVVPVPMFEQVVKCYYVCFCFFGKLIIVSIRQERSLPKPENTTTCHSFHVTNRVLVHLQKLQFLRQSKSNSAWFHTVTNLSP